MQNNTVHLESNATKGIVICLIAYLFISLIGICEKFISKSVSLPEILFFQFLICLGLTLPTIIKDDLKVLRLRHVNIHAIRIFSGLACYATLFYIIQFIPVSEAMLYQYSASLWIPFIMLFWFKTPLQRNIWYGIIVGFFGIFFIMQPHHAIFGWISIFGILCGISQGISVVAVRRLSLTEPVDCILFYYFLISTVVTAPFAIAHWSTLTVKNSLFLCGVGFFTYFGQKFLTISLQYANAITLAPICYTSILFAGLFGVIVWHEIPNDMTLVGMTLVIGGCYLSMIAAKKNAADRAEELA